MAYSHTKKVGRAGRFGPRIGTDMRIKINTIEGISKQKHECPICGKKKVVRIEEGIWLCKACNTKFAGGCYIPHGEIEI